MEDYTFNQFGRYYLLESLDKGGMGQVYLSIYGKSGWEKFCAIKRILPKSSSSDTLLRFQSEAENTVRLNHSNLVSVLDVGVIKQEAYMAMELVEGENLRAIWNRCAEKRVPFPLEVIVFLIKEAAKGLDYTHKFENSNLVHRDISPPNIMLTYSGEIKILDFGLALSSLSKRFTKPGVIYGKLPYLSPEQARGDNLDHKSDIYSLGIIFWELITGRRLFKTRKKEHLAKELKYRCSNPEIQHPSQVARRGNSELDEIVLSMLQDDPQKRPGGSEIASQLGKYLASNHPGTDNKDVDKFIKSIFGEDIKRQQHHIQSLLKKFRSWQKNNSRKNIVPGKIIAGKYKIISTVGEGGMGRVFEAEHRELGKKVAIKILEPNASMELKEAEIRFKREAKAASRIKHPSVVEVIDYGFTDVDSRPFLVMELLEGQNLGDIIDEGPLGVDDACKFASQLCLGIHASHEAGLIHRDIKPDNIHIVKDYKGEEHLKLFDFGIAKSSLGEDEDLTKPGITLGTPEYIAPELLIGEDASPKVDIYSFGAVFYELLTGSPPFQGDKTETIIHDKIHDRRKSIHAMRPDLPGKIREIVESCLKNDPRKRPDNLRRISEDLELFLAKKKKTAFSTKQIVPARISHTQTWNHEPDSTQESGNWIPLLITSAGVLIFLLGIMQVGKNNYDFLNFSQIKTDKTLKITNSADKINLPVKKIDKSMTKTEKKKTARIFRKKSKKRTNSHSHKKNPRQLLAEANAAYLKGNYPKAWELSKRSLRNGGGKKAREIHLSVTRILGLK
ncbi:MAG: serine/threonine-protein kinase [Deltaproteobacteria bacterium]|jgi:serine/threonine protein kinase|nr:serine/threonine-protein kinase [Deltaproteobacteria bacterium]